MWEDAMLGTYHRNNYLDLIKKKKDFIENHIDVLESHLNDYVNSLQKKYNDVIEINLEEFNKIELTRIDMFVLQKFEPYPIIVPPFPIVTSDHRFDYGKEMDD